MVTDASKVFEYETGFYYYGAKTYSIRSLGYCAIGMMLFLFISVIAIIGPLLAGATVKSELKAYAFDTPAEAPQPGNLIPSQLG